MDNLLSWEEVKEFYKNTFGIDKWVVEMLANRDILVLCVSGASNATISVFLEIEETEVGSVIGDTLKFAGFKEDLPLNPYILFKDIESNADIKDKDVKFCTEVASELIKYPDLEQVDLGNLYRMCKVVHDIEGRIEDEWI